VGNPASDDIVKLYLKQVTAKQLQAKITPKQATPIFPDKLLLLSRHLEKRLLSQNVPPCEVFITARDQAFFKCLFYSGDRAGDLGLVKMAEIARFPDDSGLLFNHTWGKTLRDGSSNLFGMRRHPNPSLCPVKGIEMYVAIAREIGIDLSRGYLFRPTDHHGHIVDLPLTSSAAKSRLKLYHGRRNTPQLPSGCALTLSFCGSQLADVMSHVGWSSPSTAQYYLKLADVIRAVAPADRLSQESSQSSQASNIYMDFNNLKDFISAFPSQSSAALKRSAPDA
jgi:integrase